MSGWAPPPRDPRLPRSDAEQLARDLVGWHILDADDAGAAALQAWLDRHAEPDYGTLELIEALVVYATELRQ